MSNRLKEMVREYLLNAGEGGEAKLSLASGLSVSTIYTLKRGADHIPSAKTVRKLALACGLNEEAARALVRECASEAARESA